jgi:endonuclease YncB( thermonuclease family)
LAADVILPDGRNLNHELLKAGLAWWFRKYSKDASLGDLEDEARLAMREQWADPQPVPPWERSTKSRVN